MKAALCTELNGYQSLTLTNVEVPTPSDSQVLIRIKASALNFADSLIVKGKYQVKPPLPFSPGLECAGIVEAVGKDVSTCKVGDRVMAVLDWGGFAEYGLAASHDVYPISDNLDFNTAASIPVAYGTSHHGLTAKAQLKAGETLVVHGAAGGVGLTAVEVGKRLGATVIATAGGAEKLAICKEHGADHLIDYREGSVREKIKDLTDGLGAHVAYDPVGGDLFTETFRSTRQDGRILVVGFASGDISQIPANIMMVKNITCIGYHWGAYRKLDPEALRASFAELMDWIEEGSLKPHVSMTFKLDDVKDAYEALLARKSTGKIVIEID
ncbi:NADPH:quinone oxidoreductase family protein [Terasakiella sp. A23]|uniref:NADPH:quinone oxidoreductase family protein n=1 Tax=Terasakiella sp. FCG-A23 TaxID=3080561 RepID=UPI002953737A|nr:NADPH:quinone oxidoreductase family protein [Terasakiella sp. A23]MDV7339686.1 NADPH:quinone oxidoreductase family protein [Terasakiella sp. A23]